MSNTPSRHCPTSAPMNKNLHRIIFNAARGCRMVVAETARSCRKAASGASVAAGLMGLLVFMGHPVQAQIIADPNAPGNQRPVIINTANGLPQVNIQTPSAAGVSRNTYSQFDVQAGGAILNNSAANVQTQLGGWIAGNTMLAGGAARVILNEVNSSNPSLLKGYVEVAGSKAEVIIANPSGIQVNGGGFINASTVTLTTGAPVMNGGNLESYRVSGGRIQIDGLGLDTRTASVTQILSRAADINAGLWANHLKLVLGANLINAADPTGAATGNTPVPIAPNPAEAKPRFALDVAAIGGMYAGHIFLIGTEKGLGVNTAGQVQANAGDLVLQANGWLTNTGALQASGNISITTSGSSNSTANGSAADGTGTGTIAAHGVANSGSIYAGGQLTVQADGQLSNDGSNALMAAAGNTSVQAGNVANSGTLAAGVQADGTIGSTGKLSLSTAGTFDNSGTAWAGDSLTVNAAELNNSVSGELASANTRIVVTNTFTNRGMVDGADTRIDAETVRNVGTGRIYGDTVSIAAATVSNEAETVTTGGTPSTHAAVIAARNWLDMGVGTLTNNYANGQGALIYSGGDMAIGGSLDANRRATGSADSVHNASATIQAQGQLDINAKSISNTNEDFAYETRLVNTQTGIYEAPGSNYYRIFDRYTYEPVVTQDQPGQILAGGNLTLSAEQITNQQSKILAGGALTINGTSVNNLSVTDQRRVNDVGTQWSWGVVGGHSECWLAGFSFSCRWVYDWGMVPSAYNVETLTPVTVSSGVTAANSNPGNASTTIGSRTPGTTGLNIGGSSLFRPAANSNASYLLETDPRFTQYKTWLGSDYMLTQLAADPATLQKRLGDGFYEQQLIRDQVAQLTGRRFLGNYVSDEQQFRALMDAGVTYAKAFNIRPGIALSAAQMAELTSDMVLLVEKEVTLPDGSTRKALVPQLYARLDPAELRPDGALLSGRDVQINTTQDLLNNGSIQGQRVVNLAAANITNQRGTIQGNNVTLSANQDISNTSGTVAAQDSLSLAAGRDIHLTSQASASTHGSVAPQEQATLTVKGSGGTLSVNAGRDINLAAAQVNSAGNATLNAGRDVNLAAVSSGESLSFRGSGDATFAQDIRQTTQTGSRVSASGNLSMAAGNNVSAVAADIGSGGNTTITADNNILLAAGQSTRSSDLSWTANSGNAISSRSTATRTQEGSATAIATQVSGANVAVSAGNNLTSIGTQFSAGGNGSGSTAGNLTVEGKNSQGFYEAVNVQQSSTETRTTESVLGISLNNSSSTSNSLQTTAVASRLTSTERINIQVGNQATLQGAEVQAPTIAISSSANKANPAQPGELILGASVNTTQTSRTEKSETAGVWQTQSGSGSTTQTANLTQLQGNAVIDPGLRVTVRTGNTAPSTQALQTQLQSLAQQPGLTYLKDLQANPNVKWEQIQLANEQWRYSQQGLTPAGAALLSIAVAYATAGAGASAGASLAGSLGATGATGAAVSTGLQTLAAQASVALVNNGGDIGKMLQQLGSEQSVKSLLIAMGSAGVGTSVAGQGVNAVAAQTAAGCVAGEMNGAGCEQGAKTAAVLSGASETYRAWVGYGANAGPGENRLGSTTKDGTYQKIETPGPTYGQQLPADRGMNVVGLNEPGSWLSQGGTLSRAINEIPFVNATAGLHDYIFNANPELNFTLWNVPTMLPAAVVSIPAALNNPNIYWLTQIKLPTAEPKPPVPPSVIRIANPLLPVSVTPKESKK